MIEKLEEEKRRTETNNEKNKDFALISGNTLSRFAYCNNTTKILIM